ncbi:hypothetical protein [Vibrio mediterranei]|uniref:hypothetical protein n=1 Tax=Vibrio mediterranei TaxID=689 RepID=UPI001EFD8FA9|nr:hypothetical protein [Vibrio mediterranei]MCG9660339.1 hypothetical protein [Vibrio mediterranei]
MKKTIVLLMAWISMSVWASDGVGTVCQSTDGGTFTVNTPQCPMSAHKIAG